MELLLVRHAIAQDRARFARSGADDSKRPLIPEGRKRMRRAAKGLRRLVPALDLVATSPLARAEQTAAILGKAYGRSPARLASLAPAAAYGPLLRWLATRREERVALVGHEPHLGRLACLLLAGRGSFLELRKGGACLIGFRGRPAPGRGILLWLLKPSQLRRI